MSTAPAGVALYVRALRDFLADRSGGAIEQAYDLGRQALEAGLGILDVVRMHHEAVALVLATPPEPAEAAGTREAIERFFTEVLGPFEMVYRGCREANAALRRINETLEAESRRIAHALHDEAGPLLVAAHMALADLERRAPATSSAAVDTVRARLDDLEDQLRRLSHELRPSVLDDLGLVPALRFLAEGVALRTGLRIEVVGDTTGRLPLPVETALYRIAQEAMLNAGKHARASRATVRLAQEPRRVECTVVDDGIGFAAGGDGARIPGRGLGLLGIRRRLEALGGTLRIRPASGGGTELHVSVPLEA